jgi:hypothetical protein
MEARPGPLEPGLREEVAALCREGRLHEADGDDALALHAFLDAWELLPEPREAWAPSAGILDAVADLLQRRGDLGDGLDVLVRAHGRTAAAPAAA